MLRFKRFSVLVAALLLASSAFASNEASSTINELPAIEIPAKAAELVRSAPAEKQLDLSRSILVTVLKERPQMAVQMVATLSKVAPDSAPVIAVIAASIVPHYGAVILRAAAASFPPPPAPRGIPPESTATPGILEYVQKCKPCPGNLSLEVVGPTLALGNVRPVSAHLSTT